MALEFVKRLRSLKHRSSQSTRLEVVYHWTREENVNKIIDARMLSSPRFVLSFFLSFERRSQRSLEFSAGPGHWGFVFPWNFGTEALAS